MYESIELFQEALETRDQQLRFRAAAVTQFEPTPRRAKLHLRRAMEATAPRPPETRIRRSGLAMTQLLDPS